jgi:hypothetical protein
MQRHLVMLCMSMLAGCGSGLDAEGERMALAGDGVSTTLEGSFKAGWVVAPAARLSDEALDTTRTIVNTVFGLCASASDVAPRGLSIRFNGLCGIPFSDLRFEGGLSFSERDGSLHIAFDQLHLPSVYISGLIDFTQLPDGSIAWEYQHVSAEVAGHSFTLDGSGSARYSDDRTSVRYDGAGTLTSDEVSVSFVADGIVRQLIGGGCWPGQGSLTVTLSAFGVTRTQVFHYTGHRGVKLDDRGRKLDHDLPDRDCHPLF